MNSLIIANNAPGYFRFFKPLSECLNNYGKVTFALDSTYSHHYNSIDENNYIFSNYCCENIDKKLSASSLNLVKKIQEEYGTWFLYPDADRDSFYGLFSSKVNENTYTLFCNLVAFFVEIFESENIAYIYYENASNALALIAREVGREYGAKFIGLSMSRLPGRIAILDKWESESNKYSEIFNTIVLDSLTVKEVGVIDNYLNNIEKIQPDYMKNNSLNQTSVIKKYLNIDKFKIFKFKMKYSLNNNVWDFQIGNPAKIALRSFFRNFNRSLKIFILKDYYDSYNAELKESFYLYPLHFHPEASTSLLAREYGSEYEVIRNIAYSLPYGTKLYVKDHISAYGYPSLNFYKKLKKLPNIRIIEPTAPTKSMIKSSIGVVTLTSTVGYEALLLNKPVIILGNVFYEYHQNCLKCNSLKDLSTYLKKLQGKFDLPEKYNFKFVASYYKGTDEIGLNYNNENIDDQFACANKLIKKLGFLND